MRKKIEVRFVGVHNGDSYNTVIKEAGQNQ